MVDSGTEEQLLIMNDRNTGITRLSLQRYCYWLSSTVMLESLGFISFFVNYLSGKDVHSSQLNSRPGKATFVNHHSSDNHVLMVEYNFSSSPF